MKLRILSTNLQVVEKVVEVAPIGLDRIVEHIAFAASQERDQKRVAAQKVEIPGKV